MKKIKLESRGNAAHIIAPSGNHSTVNTLELGKTYLHRNMIFLRKVVEIKDGHVYYEQLHHVGYCSKQHFVKLCPHEATEEEIEFLTSMK